VKADQTHTTIFPHFATPVSYHWVSTSHAARIFDRAERNMRRWCETGRFAAIGCPTYKDASGRWWIHLRNDENFSIADGSALT